MKNEEGGKALTNDLTRAITSVRPALGERPKFIDFD